MSVLTDSRYAALASTAARGLGASSPAITRAILSQWQCELGANAPYPPPRNNPGNIARGLATDLGLSFTVQTPNPQPGNPIVTFASAELGAHAYAAAIRSVSRYRHVLAAAVAGDGLAYVRAMGSSGWGTGTGCMLSVYGSSGGGGNNPTGTTVSYAAAPKNLAELLGHDGTMTATNAHQVTVDAAAAADALVQAGSVSAGWASNVKNLVGTKAVGVGRGGPPTKYSDLAFAADGGSPSVTDIVGGALFGQFGWVPTLATNGGVILVVAYLILSGLQDVLGGIAPEAAEAAG